MITQNWHLWQTKTNHKMGFQKKILFIFTWVARAGSVVCKESGEIPSSAEDQNKPDLQAKSNQSYSCTVPLPDKSVNWNRSYITFGFEFLHFLLNVLKAVFCINFTLLGCPKWPLRKLYFVNKTNLFNLGCPYNATRLLACFKIKSVRTEGI